MTSSLRIILAAFALLGLAAGSGAQTPSADQLELFRNLTPEQQQALMERLQEENTEDRALPAGTRDAARVGASPLEADRQRDGQRTVPNAQRSSNEERPAVPVLAPNSTLLVQASVTEPDELETTERDALEGVVNLILERNPYRLDRNGSLNLPGIPGIGLGGLTEQQAGRRLGSDPALRGLTLRVVDLPVTPAGVDRLRPFGYDLFESSPSTFSPVTDVPVPAEYVVGAGDELAVQLFGSQNITRRLVVSREGTISFPELGPIQVAGLTFSAARRAIESRVAAEMIGVQVSVTMGDTRSIRVFVLGEARQPGSYTVSGLATMTTALFASGGVKTIGSLRDIQLRRQGQLVRRFDLYDMLLGGDTSADAKLLPGDVIFVPPIGATASIDGEVKRPAIYELRGDTSPTELVRMAGGLTPEADATRTVVTRIRDGRRAVESLDLESASSSLLSNGDVLTIAQVRPQLDSGVMLEGFVHRPGAFAWREGLRLTDVIGSIDELRPNADASYVLIRRESGGDRRVSAVSANLAAALAAPGSDADPQLLPRDRITVFDLAPGRERIIRPLLEELRLQSQLARPTEVVRIGGRVKVPGEYPLEAGMRVSDLLRAGGNLDPGAYAGEAELTRYAIDASGVRQTELVTIDLAAMGRGDALANVLLQPYDYLVIKETPSWDSLESVTLRGEVKFPGTYAIRRGETLFQVLERAGGLTPLAFADGSAFTRLDLQKAEQQQLDRLAERMRSDLAALSLQAANVGRADASQALISGQSLLAQLQTAKATGRYVIDLPSLLEGRAGGPMDVMLRDGDTLVIPKIRQEVTVIGEVQNPTSHQFRPELRRADYIAMSGGTTPKADRGRIHVVRADGRVASRVNSMLARNYDLSIKPGDTVVVPLDTERMPRLPFWQAVTQILYNVAVSVAAVNSF